MEPIKIEIISDNENNGDNNSGYKQKKTLALIALMGMVFGALVSGLVVLYVNNVNTTIEKTKFFYSDLVRKQDIEFEIDSAMNDLNNDLIDKKTNCTSEYKYDLKKNMRDLHKKFNQDEVRMVKGFDKFYIINNIKTYKSNTPVSTIIKYLDDNKQDFEKCTLKSFSKLSEKNYTDLKNSVQIYLKNLGSLPIKTEVLNTISDKADGKPLESLLNYKS